MYMSQLYHHGIKGQKWGVRRFQNKDGTLTKEGLKRYKDDVIIKKGSTFQHISADSNLKLGNKKTYLAKDKWDKAVYAGKYALELAEIKNTDNIYNYTFKATQDLVSPSKKKRVDMFVDMYKDNPVKVGKELTEAIPKNIYESERAKMKKSWDVKDYKNVTEEQIRKGYDVFRRMNGSKMFSDSYSVKTYRDKLDKEGYSALIDDNDIGNNYYNVRNPVIVLKGKEALQKIDMHKMLVDEVLYNNILVDTVLSRRNNQ